MPSRFDSTQRGERASRVSSEIRARATVFCRPLFARQRRPHAVYWRLGVYLFLNIQ